MVIISASGCSPDAVALIRVKILQHWRRIEPSSGHGDSLVEQLLSMYGVLTDLQETSKGPPLPQPPKELSKTS
jgi:hypothetical protein